MQGARRTLAMLVLGFLIAACDSSVSPRSTRQTLASILEVNTKTVSLLVGQARQLAVTSSSTQVSWRSDNAQVVVVSRSGLLSAEMPGVAHVIVRAQ